MSLRITLTGQLAAEADGNRADAGDLPGRQASVVFAYLVAERDRPVPTEELAEAVWGGALPPTWRPALRGVISKVRDFLDLLGLPAAEVLTSSAGCYRLRLPTDTAVDVELAEAAAGAAQRALGEGRLAPALEAAERARAIAGRPLLPGHDGAWVEDRRAALHQVLVRSLELLVDVHLAAGHADQAVGPAADLVALEPFRDSAYRRLLAAHSAAGDRGEALRAYDRYRRVLAEELGVGPSPELEATYLELLHAEPAATTVAAPPSEASPPSPAPAGGAFVGRATELRRLRAAWAGARRGRRRTVLVAGEAGIGKTRLVSELAAIAEGEGGIVLAGRCDQHLGVPYLPLREALGRHLAAYPSERLRALLGPRAAQLVQFWPELAWRLPALPAPSPAGPQGDHYFLFEALTGLLEAISASAPLLLLVDDLHGADEASLLLLRSLAHAGRPERLLTVLTYRDDERRPRTNLTAALGDLVRAPDAELLTLDGLGSREVAAMAAATTARPLGQGGAALAHVVRERTGGNPFLVGELLRHLVERGAFAGGDVTGVAAGPAADAVPENLRWVVGQRMARLGGPVEHVVGVAAVIGQHAELALLARVADLGHESLLSALDTAVAARLLDELPGVPGRYAFHHPIVRDLLYRRLAAGERVRLHRRVGDALEDLTGGTSRLGELADHFALAGSPAAERAAGYARQAGERAFAQRRYEEAAQRHRQALAVLERHEGAGADPERRGALLLGQGDAWTAAGQTQEATQAYLRAASAARSAGSADGLTRAALGVGGTTGFWSVELDQAVPTRLLDEALEAAGPGDSHARALLLARLAGWRTVGSRLGNGQDPPGLFGEAVAMARRLGDPATLAAVLADQEIAWTGALRPDGPGAALAAGAELERLAAELGDERLAYQAARVRAGALLVAGDLRGVDRLAEQEAHLAAERRAPHRRWLSLRLRAAGALLRGEFRDSERLAEAALQVGRQPLGAAASLAHGAQLVFLRWLQGRPGEVEALLERLVAQQAWGAHAWPRLLGLAYAGQGREGDARRLLDAAMAAAPPGTPVNVAELLAATGACAQLGDAAAAGRLSELLAPWSGHHLAAGHTYLGAADHHLGILTATAGRWDDSLAHLEAALAAHERLGARPWRALTAQALAGMLRGRAGPGDQARAAALDAEAAADAGRLGMELPGWGRPVLGPRS